tara:strand:+ start:5158 stop:5961 length:804 start_codon:yes stop_codon:yes gene_type:complete
MFASNRFSRMNIPRMGAMSFGGGGILRTILIAIVALFIFYLVVNWYFRKTKKLVTMSSGTILHTIPDSELPKNATSTDYTYSMWFYINDWNYKYGDEKIILRKGVVNEESIKVSLGKTENNIDVQVSCFNGDNTSTNDNAISTTNSELSDSCTIKNVPLQKWVNLTISVYGKTLDLYLNGKLYRTCVLPGTPYMNTTNIDNVEITPGGGFNGWTTNFLYTPKPTNPQQAYNIYKKGYGGSFFGNMFNKYRIKVELLRDNEVAGGFEM